MSAGEPNMAVATVRDWGAADVACQMLAEHDIAVEIKPLGSNPYFGTLTGIELEIRVPVAQITQAEQVLARLSEEAGQALIGQAGAQAAHAGLFAQAEAVREAMPPARPKSRGLGALFSLAVPVLGPIYGGSPGLALASLLIHLPVFYELLSYRHDRAADSTTLTLFWAIGRVVDVFGTQRAVQQHNAALAAFADEVAPTQDASDSNRCNDTDTDTQEGKEASHAPVS